jgi:hypothetical protein
MGGIKVTILTSVGNKQLIKAELEMDLPETL